MRPSSKLLVISLPLLLILSGAAMADTCNSFATYTCAKGVHDGAFICGACPTVTAARAEVLLSGDKVAVFPPNGNGGADLTLFLDTCNHTTHGTLHAVS